MINSDAVVEAMIQDKGLIAPRVMPKAIDALVASLSFKVQRFEGTTTTVALALLPNGFSVAQGVSACVSPENFNAEIGEKDAVDNAREAARQKLWELEGYVLKQKLSAPVLNFKERVIEELEQLTDKVNKLAVFKSTQTFQDLSINERNRLTEQLGHMMAYAKTLVERIEAFE